MNHYQGREPFSKDKFEEEDSFDDIIGHEEKKTGNDDVISHDNAMYTENNDLLSLSLPELVLGVTPLVS